MTNPIARRDFIKIMSALPGYIVGHKLGLTEITNDQRSNSMNKSAAQPNIIILLLDALTARNISLYGYARKTMPNLEKFAKRATVYHKHYASCNGTAQSTASFFTGVHPWLHKVYNYYDKIKKEARINNLFEWVSNENNYRSFAYTDNIQADLILHQFGSALKDHLDMGSLGEYNYLLHDRLARRDGANSLKGLDILMFEDDSTRLSGSLVGSVVSKILREIREESQADLFPYPRGIGYSANRRVAFTLEKSFSGIREALETLEQSKNPYLAYYHMFFPHAPYRPNSTFLNCFEDDGFQPIFKKPHPLLASVHRDRKIINGMRRYYDEYIANIDYEFGQLVDYLEGARILNDSYLIVTSDHGEMFERGWIGHGSPLLYESNIHIPLLISKPGQQTRKDVFALTSTVDVVPTLLEMTGQPVADDSKMFEGRVLPDIRNKNFDDHSVYSMIILEGSAFSSIEKASFALFQGEYKLIEYYGYNQMEKPYELYNLHNDPEEMDDLSGSKSSILGEMRAVLKSRLVQVQGSK